MSGLYLASQSPRRTELLHQVGIDHTVVSSSYVEDNVVVTDPVEMVKAQALGKARCANDVPDGFKTLQDFEIESYIDSMEPMDKAGAYGIQGKGALWVDKIEGSYTNVVGLPVEHVYEELCKALGVK